MMILAVLAVVTLVAREQTQAPSTISYDEFVAQVDADNVAAVEITANTLLGEFREPTAVMPAAGSEKLTTFRVELSDYVAEGLPAMLLDRKIRVEVKQPTDGTGVLLGLYLLVPLLLMLGFWMTLRRARDPLGGSGFLGSFSKSPAKRYGEKDKKTTFADVAGLDQVKNDLQEIVDFLKDPKKFQKLGGRVPKGVLLMGPPGTGKTLLARAVAGEAGVPFFSISGSEFIQMFVGVGASRVRDLFKNAKEASPAILFIDEIDAVGRVRGAGLGGGHDEREQTLNQILSEMDGFSQTESVIVLAATNRPDVLDPALLRPGRFDRQIVVANPDITGRDAILQIHVRNNNLPLDDDVKLRTLARGTPGFSGADLANVVNEAALLAARRDQDTVTHQDFEDAKDRVLMGPERRSLVIGEKEKRLTAYHEAGHVLVGRLLPDADPIHKATIIPRGPSLGLTSWLPAEDRHNVSKSYCLATLRMAMGGRAAEEVMFEEFSSGAAGDLKGATERAHAMVCEWGMSELGPVAFRSQTEVFLGRDFVQERSFSEETAAAVDKEIHTLLEDAYAEAKAIVIAHKDLLIALANELIECETLESRRIDEVIRANGGDDQIPPPPEDATDEPAPETTVPAPACAPAQEKAPAPDEDEVPSGDVVPDTA